MQFRHTSGNRSSNRSSAFSSVVQPVVLTPTTPKSPIRAHCAASHLTLYRSVRSYTFNRRGQMPTVPARTHLGRLQRRRCAVAVQLAPRTTRSTAATCSLVEYQARRFCVLLQTLKFIDIEEHIELTVTRTSTATGEPVTTTLTREYTLTAIAAHRGGTMDSGHWITWRRSSSQNPEPGHREHCQWWRCNDSIVSPTTFEAMCAELDPRVQQRQPLRNAFVPVLLAYVVADRDAGTVGDPLQGMRDMGVDPDTVLKLQEAEHGGG
ncbi:MAG: ubiquitin carboxyl-terminal hydrolase, partial [Limnohabitans sp.]